MPGCRKKGGDDFANEISALQRFGHKAFHSVTKLSMRSRPEAVQSLFNVIYILTFGAGPPNLLQRRTERESSKGFRKDIDSEASL